MSVASAVGPDGVDIGIAVGVGIVAAVVAAAAAAAVGCVVVAAVVGVGIDVVECKENDRLLHHHRRSLGHCLRLRKDQVP